MVFTTSKSLLLLSFSICFNISAQVTDFEPSLLAEIESSFRNAVPSTNDEEIYIDDTVLATAGSLQETLLGTDTMESNLFADIQTFLEPEEETFTHNDLPTIQGSRDFAESIVQEEETVVNNLSKRKRKRKGEIEAQVTDFEPSLLADVESSFRNAVPSTNDEEIYIGDSVLAPTSYLEETLLGTDSMESNLFADIQVSLESEEETFTHNDLPTIQGSRDFAESIVQQEEASYSLLRKAFKMLIQTSGHGRNTLTILQQEAQMSMLVGGPKHLNQFSFAISIIHLFGLSGNQHCTKSMGLLSAPEFQMHEVDSFFNFAIAKYEEFVKSLLVVNDRYCKLQKRDFLEVYDCIYMVLKFNSTLQSEFITLYLSNEAFMPPSVVSKRLSDLVTCMDVLRRTRESTQDLSIFLSKLPIPNNNEVYVVNLIKAFAKSSIKPLRSSSMITHELDFEMKFIQSYHEGRIPIKSPKSYQANSKLRYAVFFMTLFGLETIKDGQRFCDNAVATEPVSLEEIFDVAKSRYLEFIQNLQCSRGVNANAIYNCMIESLLNTNACNSIKVKQMSEELLRLANCKIALQQMPLPPLLPGEFSRISIAHRRFSNQELSGLNLIFAFYNKHK